MRTSMSIILRLLIDPKQPHVLRGMLQPVPQGQVHSFPDEAALIRLLHQQVEDYLNDQARGKSQREIDLDERKE